MIYEVNRLWNTYSFWNLFSLTLIYIIMLVSTPVSQICLFLVAFRIKLATCLTNPTLFALISILVSQVLFLYSVWNQHFGYLLLYSLCVTIKPPSTNEPKIQGRIQKWCILTHLFLNVLLPLSYIQFFFLTTLFSVVLYLYSATGVHVTTYSQCSYIHISLPMVLQPTHEPCHPLYWGFWITRN
jgi:hypothetical protein